MYEFNIIKDLVIILLVSIPIILLFNKLRLPSITGFLIAGMIIGPFGLQLITEIDEINVMAEVGVILILFTIGLEVSLKELAKTKKLILIGGGLQVIITIVITSSILNALGLPISQSIFFGMLFSLSSTAIVLKLLSDRKELETPQGKISLAILIFQDLAIVPMFLMIDLLGNPDKIELLSVAIKLGTALLIIFVLIFLTKYLSPKVLYFLARSGLREIFTIGIILILLGTAYLTHSFGLSFALGAFIAGLILSESDYTPQIFSDIIPFRDAFNSIFFVSIGLLLDISYVLNNALEVISLAAGIVAIKFILIFILVLFLKYPMRIAVLAGFALAQIGEFSFILAQEGMKFNLVGEYGNLLLASIIITMVATPFLISFTPALTRKSPYFALQKKDDSKKIFDGHVIIGGFGLNGRNLANVLKETGIPYTIIEMNPDTVKTEKAKGENIFYGDINNEEVLKNTGIEDAKILVVAISDRAVSQRVLKIARQLNPNLYLIVRTRFVGETEDLIKLGADIVIPEEFETSIQIFRNVLEQYHIPLNVILQQVTLLRGESYKWMRSEEPTAEIFSRLNEIIAAGITETFFFNEDNSNINKTIGDLNIRALTDATVIAIVRKKDTIVNPSAKEKILANDTLVITGTHQAVDSAFKLLSE